MKTDIVILSPVEVIQDNTMPWHCMTCKTQFQGPKTHTPKAGCPSCGSRQVIDVNVRPLRRSDVTPPQIRDVSGTVRLPRQPRTLR